MSMMNECYQVGMFQLRFILIALMLLVVLIFAGPLYPYFSWTIEPKPALKTASNFTRRFGSGADRGSTKILIVTYMRSGSSLTGDILQQTPGAFYTYEPIRYLKDPGTYTFINGTQRKVDEWSLRQHYIDILMNWFTCEISNIYVQGLYALGFLDFGIKTKMFRACLNASVSTDNALGDCALELAEICFNSPVRIIKTIRMPLEWTRDLLKKLPDLKTVHLVRDPRAILTSPEKVTVCHENYGGMLACTTQLCASLERDMLSGQRLSTEFPRRLCTFFYEDIAIHPIETSKRIYDYVGSLYTPTVEEYIFNITRAGNLDGCDFCTTRRNSTEHVDKWKKASKKVLNMIQTRCKLMLKHYGYEILNIDDAKIVR